MFVKIVAIIAYILTLAVIAAPFFAILNLILSFFEKRRESAELKKYFEKVAKSPLLTDLEVVKGKNCQFEQRDDFDNLF